MILEQMGLIGSICYQLIDAVEVNIDGEVTRLVKLRNP